MQPRSNAPTTAVQEPIELSTFAVREQPILSWSDAIGTRSERVVGRMLLGSAPSVALRIEDPAVSRLHAEIELRADGHVWVRDLGSTNGTWVDGVFVQQARLGPSSRVRLGATTLALSFGRPTKAALWPHDRLGELVARSEPMRELFLMLADYARTDSAVLVQGETGTGKELVARAIHESSGRKRGPFVVVDCAALPETLLESELFGHTKGAFTGAVASRAGAFEVGDGGTVFIDEVGELPLAMQPKLLRVLETQTVRRLGETSYRSIDVRFVAATHRDLRQMVVAGAFREDLYFRLAVLPAFVPPLRERPADVAFLLEHFLAGRAVQLRPDLLDELARSPWTGNVRELKSFAERALAVGPERAWAMTRGVAGGGMSSSGSIPVLSPEPTASGGDPTVDPDVPFKVLRERINDHFEREYLTKVIARVGRDVTKMADHIELDRSYLHRLLRKHDL